MVAQPARVEIEIWEQAGAVASPDLEANHQVINSLIRGIPPLPAGAPIDITINVDVDGRLSVTAVEPASGKELAVETRVNVLPGEQVGKAEERMLRLQCRMRHRAPRTLRLVLHPNCRESPALGKSWSQPASPEEGNSSRLIWAGAPMTLLPLMQGCRQRDTWPRIYQSVRQRERGSVCWYELCSRRPVRHPRR